MNGPRVAVVSDVHANLTALEAVIADLRTTMPDMVIHGGDFVGGGPRPAEVIDRIRDLKWPGVCGNTDEMLWLPHRVSEVLQAPPLHRTRDLLLGHTIPSTRAAIGEERLFWLRTLPRRWRSTALSVVHAGPDDVWQSTTVAAQDDELSRLFGSLKTPRVVYGHLHVPFVRELPSFTLVNSGSVGQPLDRDPRAAYVLLEPGRIEIRRVTYDVDAEVQILQRRDDPFATATIQTLRTGRFTPP